MLLTDLLATYSRGSLNLSAGGQDQLAVAVRLLEAFLGRRALVSDLSVELLIGWMRRLALTRAPATINSKRGAILTLWGFAATHDLCPDPPRIPRIRQPKRIPRAWTVDEVGRILQAAGRLTSTTALGMPARRFWSALVLTVYDTGARISAVMALRWESFDAEDKTLLFLAETQKQRADQLLAITEQTVASIELIRGRGETAVNNSPLLAPSDLIFPWPYDRNSRSWPRLNWHYRKILQAAGLPSGRRDLWQKLRRTTASYVEAGGGNATIQLGHSSSQVTQRYLDPRIVQQPRQVDLLPRP